MEHNRFESPDEFPPGNIQPNPGPVKYPCQVCDKAVRSNQHGIECSNCEKWCHRVCEYMSKEGYLSTVSLWYQNYTLQYSKFTLLDK